MGVECGWDACDGLGSLGSRVEIGLGRKFVEPDALRVCCLSVQEREAVGSKSRSRRRPGMHARAWCQFEANIWVSCGKPVCRRWRAKPQLDRCGSFDDVHRCSAKAGTSVGSVVRLSCGDWAHG
jgi:hypothetical protein